MIQAPGTLPLEWCPSEIQTWSVSHLLPRHQPQESRFWTRVERRWKLSELEINWRLKLRSQTRLRMVFLREVVLPWQKILDPHSPSLMRMDARLIQPYFQGSRPMEQLWLASMKPFASLNHTEWFFNATSNTVSDLVLRYVKTIFFCYKSSYKLIHCVAMNSFYVIFLYRRTVNMAVSHLTLGDVERERPEKNER